MRKRYKIVLNLELDVPDDEFPAGGSYTHLNKLQGTILYTLTSLGSIGRTHSRVTLDKIIDKGEILEKDR
jgi:hypothetical protein